ncbi:hypothetical protein [Kitasatospora cathayae]|uniref:Uncharacterized protein n=1 Tax=Kitasatospora cathayae TaxID=3004092 RepID=A0ABY7QI68_9ACTN|nr:hypothetical protein [Kitasatospora sp. HUAS 3-15]WBP91945.1 hypothetical protein O1G21_39840 [Kitasatospora sp. HUAS 3-15]
MSFSPGQKAMAEPMLFGAPTCTVCGKEMEPSGTGRPRKYCSKACSSKADRAREKEKQELARTAAAENPRGETPSPADLPADGEGAELLELGEALRRHDERFLLQLERAERDGDGALACQALADLLRAVDGLAVRHRELAERMLDAHPTQAASPDQAAPEPLVSPRGETAALFGGSPVTAGPVSVAAPVTAPATGGPALEDRPAPVAPRGETPPPTDPALDRPQAVPVPVPPRGETAPSARPAVTAPVAPRGETPSGGERLRDLVDQRLAQQQTAPRPAAASAPQQPPVEVPVPADPMHRRLPPSDVRIALDAGRFGDWWALAGWTVNPDVYLVTGEGHQVGWVERGLAGIGDRWVAVYEGYFIGDINTQEAMLHDTPEQAAFTVHTAYLQNL